MNTKKNLFEAFEAHSLQDWQQTAAAELQGDDPWKKLSRKVQGLDIKPYYTRQDAPAGALQLSPSQGAIFGPRTWFNCPRVSVKDATEANAKALEALESGADGIFFELTGPVDFKTLLKKIEWTYSSLNFLAVDVPDGVSQELAAYMTSLPGNTPGAWYGSSVIQVAGKKDFRTFGHLLRQTDTPAENITSIFQQIIKGPGKEFSSGASETAICVELGTDFFIEIAKLRAIRQLWQQILSKHNAPDQPLHIHAWSRPWTHEAYAPHGNMIRGTTAAMAAIMGGCDVLTVDADKDDQEMETRIARNTAILLRDESRFSKVADPLAGSWYIENLASQLVTQVWNNLQSTAR